MEEIREEIKNDGVVFKFERESENISNNPQIFGTSKLILQKRYSRAIKVEKEDDSVIRNENYLSKNDLKKNRNFSILTSNSGKFYLDNSTAEYLNKQQVEASNSSVYNTNRQFEKTQYASVYNTNLNNYLTNSVNTIYASHSANNYRTDTGKFLDHSPSNTKSYKNFDLETLDKFKKKVDYNKYKTLNIEIIQKQKENICIDVIDGLEVRDNLRDTVYPKDRDNLDRLIQSRTFLKNSQVYNTINNRSNTIRETEYSFPVKIENKKDPDVVEDYEESDTSAYFEIKNNYSNKISRFLLKPRKDNQKGISDKNFLLDKGAEDQNSILKDESRIEESEDRESLKTDEAPFDPDSQSRGGVVILRSNLNVVCKTPTNIEKHSTITPPKSKLHIPFNKISKHVDLIQKFWRSFKVKKVICTTRIQSAWRGFKSRQKISPFMYYFYIFRNQINILQNVLNKRRKKIAFYKIFYLDKFENYADSIDKLRCIVLLKRNMKKYISAHKPVQKEDKIINIQKSASVNSPKAELRKRDYSVRKEKLNKNICLFNKVNKNEIRERKVKTIQRSWRDSLSKRAEQNPKDKQKEKEFIIVYRERDTDRPNNYSQTQPKLICYSGNENFEINKLTKDAPKLPTKTVVFSKANKNLFHKQSVKKIQKIWRRFFVKNKIVKSEPLERVVKSEISEMFENSSINKETQPKFKGNNKLPDFEEVSDVIQRHEIPENKKCDNQPLREEKSLDTINTDPTETKDLEKIPEPVITKRDDGTETIKEREEKPEISRSDIKPSTEEKGVDTNKDEDPVITVVNDDEIDSENKKQPTLIEEREHLQNPEQIYEKTEIEDEQEQTVKEDVIEKLPEIEKKDEPMTNRTIEEEVLKNINENSENVIKQENQEDEKEISKKEENDEIIEIDDICTPIMVNDVQEKENIKLNDAEEKQETNEKDKEPGINPDVSESTIDNKKIPQIKQKPETSDEKTEPVIKRENIEVQFINNKENQPKITEREEKHEIIEKEVEPSIYIENEKPVVINKEEESDLDNGEKLIDMGQITEKEKEPLETDDKKPNAIVDEPVYIEKGQEPVFTDKDDKSFVIFENQQIEIEKDKPQITEDIVTEFQDKPEIIEKVQKSDISKTENEPVIQVEYVEKPEIFEKEEEKLITEDNREPETKDKEEQPVIIDHHDRHESTDKEDSQDIKITYKEPITIEDPKDALEKPEKEKEPILSENIINQELTDTKENPKIIEKEEDPMFSDDHNNKTETKYEEKNPDIPDKTTDVDKLEPIIKEEIPQLTEKEENRSISDDQSNPEIIDKEYKPEIIEEKKEAIMECDNEKPEVIETVKQPVITIYDNLVEALIEEIPEFSDKDKESDISSQDKLKPIDACKPESSEIVEIEKIKEITEPPKDFENKVQLETTPVEIPTENVKKDEEIREILEKDDVSDEKYEPEINHNENKQESSEIKDAPVINEIFGIPNTDEKTEVPLTNKEDVMIIPDDKTVTKDLTKLKENDEKQDIALTDENPLIYENPKISENADIQETSEIVEKEDHPILTQNEEMPAETEIIEKTEKPIETIIDKDDQMIHEKINPVINEIQLNREKSEFKEPVITYKEQDPDITSEHHKSPIKENPEITDLQNLEKEEEKSKKQIEKDNLKDDEIDPKIIENLINVQNGEKEALPISNEKSVVPDSKENENQEDNLIEKDNEKITKQDDNLVKVDVNDKPEIQDTPSYIIENKEDLQVVNEKQERDDEPVKDNYEKLNKEDDPEISENPELKEINETPLNVENEEKEHKITKIENTPDEEKTDQDHAVKENAEINLVDEIPEIKTNENKTFHQNKFQHNVQFNYKPVNSYKHSVQTNITPMSIVGNSKSSVAIPEARILKLQKSDYNKTFTKHQANKNYSSILKIKQLQSKWRSFNNNKKKEVKKTVDITTIPDISKSFKFNKLYGPRLNNFTKVFKSESFQVNKIKNIQENWRKVPTPEIKSVTIPEIKLIKKKSIVPPKSIFKFEQYNLILLKRIQRNWRQLLNKNKKPDESSKDTNVVKDDVHDIQNLQPVQETENTLEMTIPVSKENPETTLDKIQNSIDNDNMNPIYLLTSLEKIEKPEPQPETSRNKEKLSASSINLVISTPIMISTPLRKKKLNLSCSFTKSCRISKKKNKFHKLNESRTKEIEIEIEDSERDSLMGGNSPSPLNTLEDKEDLVLVKEDLNLEQLIVKECAERILPFLMTKEIKLLEASITDLEAEGGKSLLEATNEIKLQNDTNHTTTLNQFSIVSIANFSINNFKHKFLGTRRLYHILLKSFSKLTFRELRNYQLDHVVRIYK